VFARLVRIWYYSAKLVGNNDEEFIIKEKENVKKL
jgi:hypothetical protein